MVKLIVSIMVFFLLGVIPIEGKAQSLQTGTEPCQIIVIGFVGGMRSPDDQQQGVVQIGNHLNTLHHQALQVKIYRHWFWRSAYDSIYQSLDVNRDKNLSSQELDHAPKLVIYGHSLGGWAVIKLTRKLAKAHIPVALTVQIDTVGIGDEVVPENVKFAANFYQRTLWLLRGEKQIRSKDEKQTTILGNFLIKDIGHEALARDASIADFITTRIQSLCSVPLAWHLPSTYAE